MTTLPAPLEVAPLPFPLRVEDAPEAIRRMAIAVSVVRARLDTEFGLPRLEELLVDGLREGELDLCVKAYEAGYEGDPIADRALRKVGAELQMAMLQNRDLAPGHLQVISYHQRVYDRAPHKRKQGRYGEHDHFYRNVGICILIRLACAEYGIHATRNRESRRAQRSPSGCSLIVKALARHRFNIEETSLQKKIWGGVWGELVRRIPDATFFAAFSASGR
jgi:hypothetical protein